MRYTSDVDKAERNIRIHEIDFEDAVKDISRGGRSNGTSAWKAEKHEQKAYFDQLQKED
jgi:hypothetical protein